MTTNTSNEDEGLIRKQLLDICHKFEDKEFMAVHGHCDIDLAAIRCAKRVKALEKVVAQAHTQGYNQCKADAVAAAPEKRTHTAYCDCLYHKTKYEQRTHPVLQMSGMMDGEWTHSSVNTQSMNTWLEEILQEWDDSSLTMSEFLRNLDLRVVQMTKEEYEKIPEL